MFPILGGTPIFTDKKCGQMTMMMMMMMLL